MYCSSVKISAALSAIVIVLTVLRLTAAAPTNTVGSILSQESRRFVNISDKGEVTANGDFRKYYSYIYSYSTKYRFAVSARELVMYTIH